MGISGLLPFLKNAARPINIKEFKGCTVAVDSYCWLHKGTFSCADKLVLGEHTEQYVYYCMKYVKSLLSMGIRPIMVFDGCSLPSKKDVEKQRRQRREANKKKAAELLREGRRAEARDAFRMCIDITSEMALNLMKACRDIGVDCIVAPYEADAQLAYLNKIGVAQVIITEDSDLLLFGCERVMFKMDIAGNGVLIEQSSINKALGMKADCYSFEKFRYICILSGCDYLASLPGIGLKKAALVFQRTRQPDMNEVIKKIPTTLNMKTLTVTPDYIEGFFRANNTFLHQLVYDPTKRKILPLNPYPEGTDQSDFLYAGPYLPEKLALQLALGNLSVYNMEQIYEFVPDNFQPKSRPNYSKDMFNCLSIWDRNYRPLPRSSCYSGKNTEVVRGSTLGKEVTVHVKAENVNTPGNVKKTHVKRKSPVKRHREEEGLSERDLLNLYNSPSSTDSFPPQQAKRRKSELASEQNNPVDDSQVLGDLSDLLTEAQNGSDRISNLEDAHVGISDSMNTSLEESQLNKSTEEKKRKTINKFKVTKEVSKPKLNLNIKSGIKVEVTSRYFSASKPTKKLTFLNSIEDKAIKSSATDRESDSSGIKPCTTPNRDQATDSLTESAKQHPFDSSVPEPNSNGKPSPPVPTPYGLFTFKSKLNSFKSDFDGKPLRSISSMSKGVRETCNRDPQNLSHDDKTKTMETSASVIDLSSQKSDSSSSLTDSQVRSFPGSIDQDSFNFTQNDSQESFDDTSQRGEASETGSTPHGGSLRFTNTKRLSLEGSLGEKLTQGLSTANASFYLGPGGDAGVDRGSDEECRDLTTDGGSGSSMPHSSQNSAGCRSIGLSKSANSTPSTGSSIKKTLSGSCRSSGLKKRMTTRADSENNQTSIKAFFSKNFAYNKGNKDMLLKRKPLSPTNIIGDC